MSSELFLYIFYNYWVLYIQTAAAIPIMFCVFRSLTFLHKTN